MLATRIVKNSNGEHFAFRLRDRGVLAKSLSPKRFRDEFSTLAFIRRLTVPNGHWHRLCQSIGNSGYDAWRNAHPWLSIEEYIAQCLIKGDIQVFSVKSSDGLKLTVAKRKFKNDKGVSYEFTPACQLLTTEPEIKQITSPEQIQRFLDTLKPSKEQLDDLVKSLDLPGVDADSSDAKTMADKLTDSISKGEVVITIAEEPRKPEAEETLLEVITKAVDLGPHESESEEKEDVKEEEPVCKLQKLTVSCAHDGRQQVITSKSAAIPSLDVVASVTSKRGFEIIKATVQTDAACGTHTSSSSSISRDPEKTIKGSLENTYHLASAPISNPLKVLWLPSIKPTTYKIAARACETYTPSSIEVNVFPKIKWSAKIGYDLGDVTNSKFYGKIIIDHDEEKRFLNTEYQHSIKAVTNKLSWIKEKVDKFLAIINDGSNVKIEPYWPNLFIDYEAELKEDSSSTEVVSTYALKIEAKPLIGLKGSIDLFPIILKAARANPAAASVAAVLERVMEGVGSEKGIASLQAEVKLVFSIDSRISINFSGKGTNGKEEGKGKSEQALEMRFILEGVIGAKGHVWIIKFEKSYKAGIKTGFTGKAIIERDDAGYFWYSRFLFNGLVVYFTKYEKLEKSVTGETNMSNFLLKKAPSKIDETSKKEWTWIKASTDPGSPEPDSSSKHYIIKF